MFDWLRYEHKTVRAVRGTARRLLDKLESDGWELVSEESGTLRTTLKTRRPRTTRGWLQVGGIAVGVVTLVTAVSVGIALEDEPSPNTGDDRGGASAGERPARDISAEEDVASSLGRQPMAWGNWEVVGEIAVDEDLYGNFDPVFDVRNTGDEPDEGTFDVIFIKGKKVLGDAWCRTSPGVKVSDPVLPGATMAVLCESYDRLVRGWTEIQIKDTF